MTRMRTSLLPLTLVAWLVTGLPEAGRFAHATEPSLHKRSPGTATFVPLAPLPAPSPVPVPARTKPAPGTAGRAKPPADTVRSTPKPVAVTRPDERPLWRLFHADRLDDLQREIASLQRRYPAWRPPAQLQELMAEARVRDAIGLFARDGDPQPVMDLAGRHPRLFDGRRPDFAWALAEAYHSAGRPVLELLLRTLQQTPRPADRVATLQKGQRWVGEADYEQLLAVASNLAADGQPDIQQAIAEYRYQQALDLLERQDYPAAAERVAGLSDFITGSRDHSKAMAAGWIAYHNGEWAAARHWFDLVRQWEPGHVPAAIGVGLAWQGEGKFVEAANAVRPLPPSEAGRTEALTDILHAQADAAIAAEDHAAALRYLDEAAELAPAPRERQLMLAWSLYELQDPAALDAFEQLHETKAEAQTAQGVFASLLQADRIDELAERGDDPLLADLYRRHRGRVLFAERRFFEAEATDPGAFPQLRGLTSPTVSAGGAYGQRSGQEGLSRLYRTTAPIFQGTIFQADVHRLGLQVDQLFLDSGHLVDAADIGGAAPGKAMLATGAATGFVGTSPRLTYDYFGPVRGFARLGTTPIGGAVTAWPTLELGLRASNGLGPFAVQGYSVPVDDSLLAFVGIQDPYGTGAWGRVQRSGLRVEHDLRLGKDDLIGVSAQADLLHGEAVTTNFRGGGAAHYQHSFQLPGFEYVTAGLVGRYDAYRHNLSHFTLGHGGYFSPQHHARFRLTGDLLTKELQPFLISAHLGVGFGQVLYDEAPRLPLAPDGRTYPASQSAGFEYEAEIKALLRLGGHLQGGPVLSALHSQYFDQVTLGLQFTYSLDPKGTLTQADLPESR